MFSFTFIAFVLVLCSFAGAKKADMESYMKRTGQKFLAEMASKEGVIRLKSGMLIEVVQSSTLKAPMSPTVSDSCDVTYAGTFKDGTPFDSGRTSFAPNQVINLSPFLLVFSSNSLLNLLRFRQVIKGWTEAMQYMVEGNFHDLTNTTSLAPIDD